MKFNKQKLKELQHGWEHYTNKQLIEYLTNKIYWLATHNKNYTNMQYHLILDMQEVLETLEA